MTARAAGFAVLGVLVLWSGGAVAADVLPANELWDPYALGTEEAATPNALRDPYAFDTEDPPVVLDLQDDGVGVCGEALRTALACELGAPIASTSVTRARGTVMVRFRRRRGEMAVTYDDPDRGLVGRVVSLPPDPDEALHTAVQLAGNLVRNEAQSLLSELVEAPAVVVSAPPPVVGPAPPPVVGPAPPPLSFSANVANVARAPRPDKSASFFEAVHPQVSLSSTGFWSVGLRLMSPSERYAALTGTWGPTRDDRVAGGVGLLVGTRQHRRPLTLDADLGIALLVVGNPDPARVDIPRDRFADSNRFETRVRFLVGVPLFRHVAVFVGGALAAIVRNESSSWDGQIVPEAVGGIEL